MRFARDVAATGPRPAAGVAEMRAQRLLGRRFQAAGMRVSVQNVRVPGKGRSRNVIGVRRGRGRCLRVVMAHADTVAGSPGANDNASGLGALAELAGRTRRGGLPCELWLVGTGAEERIFTGARDHLGALALARLVRRNRGPARLRWALSLDEVGRSRSLALRSPAAGPRSGVERAMAAAARRERVALRWQRDASGGLSDHREFHLLGLRAMKLGSSASCYHQSCDTAGKLDRVALGRHVRVVGRALAGR
ncbi:MAG TPA: M28 family peptidase [Thermoleophilaceae bacterium]|nr:M28 family peptidase [Thermoleophilaceae bacterium]